MQIVDSWLRDLPQQFQGKHNIEVLIKAFSKQMQELEKMFHDLNTMTDIDTATGKNLDYVGTIIPLTRKEAGELAGIRSPDPVISDERYRQFLRYQNLVNTNECTYYDLMEGLSILWDVSPIYYIEDPDMPATIILTMPFLNPGGEPVCLGEVPMVKPAGVRIEFQYLVRYAVETLVNWVYAIYSVPLCNQLRCGQHPRRGSLGKVMLLQTEIGIEKIMKIFEQTRAGTIRVGGKLYDSTIGKVITEDVEIDINADYQIENVILAGQIVSGTHPIHSVNGFVVRADAEASENTLIETADLPLTGTYPNRSTEALVIGAAAEASQSAVIRTADLPLSGTRPERSSNCVIIGSSIETDKIVSNVKVNAPLSGTLVTGGSTEEKVLVVNSGAISTEPIVHIAAVKARRCGTGVCGNKS